MLGVLLQAGGAAPGGGQSGMFLLLGGFIIIFYFFMIRPQQKKQKDQKKFTEGIKKGDMVVTMGGIHGKVVATEKDSVLLEIDRGTKMKIEKSSISLEASKQYASKE
jgi:preprotein translocase subunit YajC